MRQHTTARDLTLVVGHAAGERTAEANRPRVNRDGVAVVGGWPVTIDLSCPKAGRIMRANRDGVAVAGGGVIG